MSGSKTSDWELDPRAEALMEARRKRDEALRSCYELLVRLENLCSVLAETGTTEKAIEGRLREFRDRLQRELSCLRQEISKIEEMRLPQKASEVDLGYLGETTRNMQHVASETARLRKMADEIERHHFELVVADSSLAGVVTRLRRSCAGLASSEELASRWMPERYQELLLKSNGMNEAVEQIRKSISEGQGGRSVSARIEALERNAHSLEKAIEDMRAELALKEDCHKKRLYVLKGLREACARLGFQETSEPDYEERENRNSAIVQCFDTLNRGKIVFRLHLDGRVDSDSGMILEACEDEHGKLSRLLMEEYGVATEFRRTKEESPPEVIKEKSKPLPRRHKPGSLAKGG